MRSKNAFIFLSGFCLLGNNRGHLGSMIASQCDFPTFSNSSFDLQVNKDSSQSSVQGSLSLCYSKDLTAASIYFAYEISFILASSSLPSSSISFSIYICCSSSLSSCNINLVSVSYATT